MACPYILFSVREAIAAHILNLIFIPGSINQTDIFSKAMRLTYALSTPVLGMGECFD